ARMVRNLWEQIGFVREQLTRWGKENDHTVRLKAYSSHYNVSFEIPKRQQNKHRNIQKLALLLAYILPVPVMVAGGNRRRTAAGVGVRPRGNRSEVTVDFTPDPGLMIATATLIVGVVREVMSWPSYELSLLRTLPIPIVDGVVPGKHTTRKGWLTKDFHYPQSPYTCNIDQAVWTTQYGEKKSLRCMASEVAWFFRRSIAKYSDPFSMRLLFAVMSGRAPSLLELVDRPAAYEDVGNLCRWGMVIHELKSYEAEMALQRSKRQTWEQQSIDEYIVERAKAREVFTHELERVSAPKDPKTISLLPPSRPQRRAPSRLLSRRRTDTPGRLAPPRPVQYLDRRDTSLLPPNNMRERRRGID